jgi:hypothetical protein
VEEVHNKFSSSIHGDGVGDTVVVVVSQPAKPEDGVTFVTPTK